MDLIVHYSYLPTYSSLITSLIPENQTPIDLPIFPFSLIVPLLSSPSQSSPCSLSTLTSSLLLNMGLSDQVSHFFPVVYLSYSVYRTHVRTSSMSWGCDVTCQHSGRGELQFPFFSLIWFCAQALSAESVLTLSYIHMHAYIPLPPPPSPPHLPTHVHPHSMGDTPCGQQTVQHIMQCMVRQVAQQTVQAAGD